jgi:hypothetical protein
MASQPPGEGPRLGRSWLVLLLVGVVGLLPVLWVTGSGGDGAGPQPTGSPVTLPIPVGEELTATVDEDGGVVALTVHAELPADRAAAPPAAIPVGVPVTLTFTVPPEIEAGDAPAVAARPADVDPDSAGAVPLDRGETFHLTRGSGVVRLPHAPGGAGAHAAHQPGEGLAATIPGGALEWASKVSPAPDAMTVEASTGQVAFAYEGERRVEVLDLVRRRRPQPVELGAAPSALAFAPDGALWVATDDGTIALVDVGTGAVTGELDAGSAVDAIHFGGAASEAVLVDQTAGTVSLLDVGNPGRSEPVVIAGGIVGTAGVRDGVAVLADGGQLIHVRRRAVGLDAVDVVDTGPSATALAVTGEGRRAVVLHAGADRATVVDLEEGAIVGQVETGAEPAEVVFLDHFAVIRNAGSADLTWIDLEVPERSNEVPLGEEPATAITVSADGSEVLVTSPGDGFVYRLHTMMGRPMVMDQDANDAGADVMIAVSTGLSRSAGGALSQRTVFDRAGAYQLELTLADGVARFPVVVAQDTADGGTFEPLEAAQTAALGEPVTVRFRVRGVEPSAPTIVAYTSSPAGTREVRETASPLEDGVWQAVLTPPMEGTYIVWLTDEVAGLGSGSGEPAVLVVTAPGARP